jgi:succinoglycan biosynthesis protein ExoI
VTDGDTIEIRGERIRLHGIDAPESGQWCLQPFCKPHHDSARQCEERSRFVEIAGDG